ncbi:MAG: hypothetical protein ACP5N6_07525 [Anaerolineae bacterium]
MPGGENRILSAGHNRLDCLNHRSGYAPGLKAAWAQEKARPSPLPTAARRPKWPPRVSPILLLQQV